jgi:hypothetical protein
MSTDKQKKRAPALRCARLGRLRRARLTRAIVGQWTRWEKGTAVTARKQDDGNYFIRRVRPKQNAMLECMNSMASVPRDLLRFEAKSNDRDVPTSGKNGEAKR